MNKATTTTAKAGRARQACRVLLVSGLLALAGCMGEGGLLDDDPLRGGGRPISTNATPAPSARAVSDGSTASAGPTALPPPSSPTSTAALVNGGQALAAAPPAEPVRPPPEIGVTVGGPRPITNSRLEPVAAAGGLPSNPAPLASSGSGVVQAGAVTTVPTPNTAPTPATTEESYEQLQQKLLQHGVSWQQLKTGTAKGEWIFVCTIPEPGASNIEKHFEAHAVGPFGLNAIQAALKEIDDDRAGR
jgi:hypothetical protein